MKSSGIYKIENVNNGRFYVGSAVVIRNRLNYHRRRLTNGNHPNRLLQNAWNKHGSHSFVFTPILLCSTDHLLMYEQLVIDRFGKALYNLSPRAGSQLGFRHSDDSKEAMSEMKIGRKASSEHRVAISAALKGHAVSARCVAALVSRRKGSKASGETRAKQSAAKIGKSRSAESIAKMVSANTGKKRTAEQKARLSIGQLRRWRKEMA